MSAWTWFRWSPADDRKLTKSVKNADGYAQVIADLGWSPSGAAYRRVKNRISELELDTAHFLGAGHGRGYKQPSEDVIKGTLSNLFRKYKLSEKRPKSSRLRVLLLQNGIRERKCEKCQLFEWMGLPIPLDLDHVDGDRFDNRLSNVRLLCPNCHAQTETHGAKNKKTMRIFRASGIDLSLMSTKKEDCEDFAKKMGWTVRSLQSKIRTARRAKKLAAQSTQPAG